MADNEHKVEIEFGLKDDMSPILRAIEDTLRNVNSQLAKTGTSEGGSISRVTQSTRELGEEAKRTSGFLDNMGGFLAGVGRSLGGAGGLAGMAIYAATETFKQLEKFAVGSLQMKAFARDTGFSVEQIKNLQLQYQRAGEPIEKANAQVVKFGAIFDQLIRKQTTSPFFQELYRYNQDLAENVLRLTNAGQRWEAVKLIRDEYFRAVANGQTLYAERLLGLLQSTKTTMTVMNDSLAGAVTIWRAPTEVAKEAEENLKEYLRLYEGAKDFFKNLGMDIAERAVFSTITDPEARRKAFDELRKQEGTVRRDLGGSNFPLPLGKALPGIGDPKDLLDKKDDSKRTTQDISDILKRLYGEQPPIPRQEGGPVWPGSKYRVGEAGPELFQSGGKYQMVGEGGPEVIQPSAAGVVWSRAQAFMRGGLTGMAGAHETSAAIRQAQQIATAMSEIPATTTPVGRAERIGTSAIKTLQGIQDPLAEAQAFRQGGLVGLAEARGAQLPGWLAATAQALRGPRGDPNARPSFGMGDSEELTSQAEYMNVHGKMLQEQLNNPAVRNWVALNQELKLLANQGRFGQAEGEVGGGGSPSGTIFGRPIIKDLRSEQERMEEDVMKPAPKWGWGWHEQDPKTRPPRGSGLRSGDYTESGQPISLDRDAIDRSLGNGGGPKVNGSMIFENVPPGVKVTTEADGFDDFTKTVNKQPFDEQATP